MYQYHCLNPIANVGLDLFTEDYQKTEELDGAQAVLVRSAAMHEMELPDSLEVIARAGAGVNNIPLEKCADKGIVVFNTPGANANGVKELVFAGMLLASRDVVGGINWVLENKDSETVGKDAEKAKKAFAGQELAGKKLGVIGLGAIGVKVANAATHLGMEVYGYDPFISVNAAWSLSRNVKHINSVDDIYKECDYITIHVPLLEDTKKMLNKAAFDEMKDGVIIINNSRGQLVVEQDLADALNSGKVHAAGLDVVSSEPIKEDNPLLNAKNCIITPHISWAPKESRQRIMDCAGNNLEAFLSGKPINVVNS